MAARKALEKLRIMIIYPVNFQLKSIKRTKKTADYVFCGHCNTKVARKTYCEHQNLEKNYIGNISDETSHESAVVNSPFDMEDYRDEDLEYPTDEEDQVFYSDSDGAESDTIEPALPNNADDKDEIDPGDSEHSDNKEFEHCEEEEYYQDQRNTSVSSESRL